MKDFGATRFERNGAACAGVAAVIAGVGAGELVAAVVSDVSPITGLATAVIDRVPTSVERWAIETFGTNDKVVLGGAIVAVLVAAGGIVGYRARTNRVLVKRAALALGLAGIAITAFARTTGLAGLVSVLVAACIGGLSLHWLLNVLDPFHGRQQTSDSLQVGMQRPIDRRRFVSLSGATAIGGLVVQRLAASQSAAAGNRAEIVAAQIPLASVAPSGEGGSMTPRTIPPVANQPAGVDFGISGVAPWRVPNNRFYRIDTAFAVPRVNTNNWSMTIGGMVDRKTTYTYDDLVSRVSLRRNITLMCVSNEVGGDLVGNAFFEGVPLKDLLEECGNQSQAEQIFSTSVDGWTCGFPLSVALDGRDAMVAVRMNGEPLPELHGFPARLVIPGIYGYVSATKWLQSIELLKWSDAEGYWIPRGWSRLAPIKTASRIDVPKGFETIKPGPSAIAGVAWAQHTGIDKVEISIDDADWQVATLAADGGIDTWRQWKFTWEAAEGDHTIAVRAIDRAGNLQPIGPKALAPDGPEGWHTVRVRVRS